MKKLISVFAALALVGSLTAQKKPAVPAKPAAPAAPAAPAVAKPAAPAAPAVAAPAAPVAAPAMAGASKGIGLSIEGYGLFTLSAGTTTSNADGSTTGTSVGYKAANTSAFGGGGSIGFDIMNNVGLQGSFDFRSHSSREWATTGAATSTKFQNKFDSMWVGLGLRPRVAVGPGFIYGGGGVALVLPHSDTSTQTTTVTATGTATVSTIKSDWNLAIGAYGEVGYQFNITDMIYVGLGGRVLVAGVDNKDKTIVTTVGSAAPTTVTYKESVSAATEAAFRTKGITDISATLSIGFRL